MTERDLPPLEEGLQDAAGLARLLADIEACTRLLEVRLKGARRQRAQDGQASVAAVHAMLLDATCRGVQLRYRFQDAEWWDTIMPAPGGFRVVRIRHQEITA